MRTWIVVAAALFASARASSAGAEPAGAPVRAASAVESRPRWGLVGLGVATGVVAYGWWRAELADVCRVRACPDVLELPVVGPFAGAVARARDGFGCPREAPAPCFLYPVVGVIGVSTMAFLGAVQLGSVALVAAGLAFPEKRSVSGRSHGVRVRPFVTVTAGGVVGTF